MNRYISLSLDDFSPDMRTGGNFESIYYCQKLIKEFPDFKVNLFVPAAYCRLGEKPKWLSDHKEWVKRVNDLPENFRINMHGLYHRRSKVDHKWHKKHESNNDEFEWLDENQANSIIIKMINEFEKAGLRYTKTFRPPGWKISIGSTKALVSQGFIIAGTPKYYNLVNKDIDNLRWVNQTWCIKNPFVITNTVIATGHTSNWAVDYFNSGMYNIVRQVILDYGLKPIFLEDALHIK